MIDFPNSPTVGQQFTAAGAVWTWDGAKWTVVGLAGQPFLPLSGGTLTGPLTLASDPTGNLQASTKQYVDAQNAAQPVAMNDNRIINGDMRIDQRNNGASGTAAGYTVDRWYYSASQTGKLTWQRQAAGPPNFPYILASTSQSAYSPVAADSFFIQQPIEADQIGDLAWGTANAQSVTLSFWVATTQTGFFSGSIQNYAATRSYPFNFNIPTANVWTKIIVTIPGDTAGTWVMSGNGGSLCVNFDLGSGSTHRGPVNAWASASYMGVTGAVSPISTSGAQFNLTGVKLEIGSIATPFNRQSLAKSLADCQRYYNLLYNVWNVTSYGAAGSGFTLNLLFPPMRIYPAPTYGVINYSNIAAGGPTTAGSVANQTSSLAFSNTVTAAGSAYWNGNVALNAEL